MFILSMKASRIRLAALLSGIVLAGGAMLLFMGGEARTVAAKNETPAATVETNEERIDYLRTFGWTVSGEACEIVEVAIPNEFNEVYENYNGIQKNQGFDLLRYRGKRVKRYSYAVENYPGQLENVRANLLVYNNQVIGGDVCSLELDGFMHGFRLVMD